MKHAICIAVLLAGLNASAAISEQYASRLATAIYHAEGGAKTSRPYGIMSKRRLSESEARRWCLNTIRNNHARWEAGGRRGDYLAYLARVYCPTVGNGLTNAEKSLNINWLRNVKAIYEKQWPVQDRSRKP